MEENLETNNKILRLISQYESTLVNLFFWFFLLSFFIDRVLNYFIHFPFFVGSALLIFPFLFYFTLRANSNRKKLLVLLFSFLICSIISSFIYLFAVKNISDLLFIVLFFTIYYYYKNHLKQLKISNAYALFVMSLFLFSFTLFGIDSNARFKMSYPDKLNWINYFDQQEEENKSVDKIETVEKEKAKEIETQKKKKRKSRQTKAKENRKLKWEKNPLDKIDKYRVRYYGLFRQPHMASYFFGFLFLFFGFYYQRNRKTIHLVLAAISLIACVFAGAKAILVAFVLSVLLFLTKRKYLIYLLPLLGLIITIIVANDFFLQISKDTVAYQYFSFFKTASANITKLSRYRLIYSWWVEVQEFGVLDFLFGKSYLNSMVANRNNLGLYIWFHNDFLSIFYTYGVWCFGLYVWFFVEIYRDNKSLIQNNIFIFVFYFSMIFSALFNGFYYYFPVLILYIFFLMIRTEKQLVH